MTKKSTKQYCTDCHETEATTVMNGLDLCKNCQNKRKEWKTKHVGDYTLNELVKLDEEFHKRSIDFSISVNVSVNLPSYTHESEDFQLCNADLILSIEEVLGRFIDKDVREKEKEIEKAKTELGNIQLRAIVERKKVFGFLPLPKQETKNGNTTKRAKRTSRSNS